MPKSLTDTRTLTTIGSLRESESTIDSTWLAAGQRRADDDLLDWPPDVFAFTDVILDRAEAYRFVVSPAAGRAWPPVGVRAWREHVRTAARRWSGWAEDRLGSPPRLVIQEWTAIATGCLSCHEVRVNKDVTRVKLTTTTRLRPSA